MTNYQPRLGSVGQRSIDYLREHGRTSLRDLADGIDAEVAGMPTNLKLCVDNGLIIRDGSGSLTFFSLPPTAESRDVDTAQAGLLSLALTGGDTADLPPAVVAELSADGRKAVEAAVDAEPSTAAEVVKAPNAPPEAMREISDAVGRMVTSVGDAGHEEAVEQVGGTPLGDEMPRLADDAAAKGDVYQPARPIEGCGVRVVGSPVPDDVLRERLMSSGALRPRASVSRTVDAGSPVEPPPAGKRHFEFGLFSDGRFVIELAETEATLTRDETEKLFKFVQGIEGAFHAKE